MFPEPSSLNRAVHGQSRNQNYRHGVLGKFTRRCWREMIEGNVAGRQGVVTEDALLTSRHCHIRLAESPPLILVDLRMQKRIERRLTARKRGTVVVLSKW